jgi:hypothetical protein
MAKTTGASKQSVSLYPEHERAVRHAARTILRLNPAKRTRWFSPTVQFIISDWERLRKAEEAARQPAIVDASEEALERVV